MIETRKFEVGGQTYTMTGFGARRASQLTIRLARLLATLSAARGDVAGALAAPSLLEDLEVARDAVLGQMTLRTSSYYEGRAGGPGKTVESEQALVDVWDDHFAGKPDELFALVILALEWSFRPLWREGGALAAAMEQLSPKAAERMSTIGNGLRGPVPIRSSGASSAPSGSA